MYIQPLNPYGYNFCPCCWHKIINSTPFTVTSTTWTNIDWSVFVAANDSEPTKNTYQVRPIQANLEALS